MNKYEQAANKVLKEVESTIGDKVTIEYWKSRATHSGIAYFDTYRIKVPHPDTDKNLNTFLHELGHLVIHVKPSCLNEYRACMFALDKMKENNIKINNKIKRHHRWYIAFSLAQALNRKLKVIPQELKPFKKYLSRCEVHYINGNGKKWVSNQYYADISKC